MDRTNEIEIFARLVDKVFDSKNLQALSPEKKFSDSIRDGEIYPVKWLLAEADRSKMNEDDLKFIDYLRQKNF